jgi:tRNA (guanine37-N1)-methyltransferase
VVRDTFARGLLDYPQYTRPAEFRGMNVPTVLLSGNHAEIERWRRREALARTLELRPDLLEHASLDAEDQKLLNSLRREESHRE